MRGLWRGRPREAAHRRGLWPLVALAVAAATSLGGVTTAPPARATAYSDSAFVGRSGATLMLAGRPFRFSGTNMYWLVLDDNVRDATGSPTHPTPFRIDDAMRSAQDAGASVVRAWADTVGCPACIEPSLGHFDDAGFTSLDYAVASARRHHIRLVLTLADNWSYYDGGKLTYTGWRGVGESAFFSNLTVIGDYEAFIDHVVSHVDPYTGLAYRDDPTVLGWETGNEMWCQTCAGNYWDGSWTRAVADHLKAAAPRQLVVDGHGVDPSCRSACLNVLSLQVPSVDMVDDHFYPMQLDRLRDASAQASGYGKAYVVGEFDWTNHDGGDALTPFLAAVESAPVAGDLTWVLVPHDDTAGLVDHNDGFQLFYPGRTADEQTRVSGLRAHAYRMSGLPLPARLLPAAPVLHLVWQSAQAVRLSWRGSAGASTYLLQRSVDGAGWTTSQSGLTDALDDAQPGYTTPVTPGHTYRYRLAPYTVDGRGGTWSAPLDADT